MRTRRCHVTVAAEPVGVEQLAEARTRRRPSPPRSAAATAATPVTSSASGGPRRRGAATRRRDSSRSHGATARAARTSTRYARLLWKFVVDRNRSYVTIAPDRDRRDAGPEARRTSRPRRPPRSTGARRRRHAAAPGTTTRRARRSGRGRCAAPGVLERSGAGGAARSAPTRMRSRAIARMLTGRPSSSSTASEPHGRGGGRRGRSPSSGDVPVDAAQHDGLRARRRCATW